MGSPQIADISPRDELIPSKALERAEFKAQLAGSVPEFKCDDCGWQAVGERWVAPGVTGDQDDNLRLVEVNPSWLPNSRCRV